MNLHLIVRHSSKIYFHSVFQYLLGSFHYVAHYGSSSQYVTNYDSTFQFTLLGLGETYDEILLERKDLLTGDYVRSNAVMIDILFSNLYFVHAGQYFNCRCAETGQHRFKIRTNGVNISYYDFPILRLRSKYLLWQVYILVFIFLPKKNQAIFLQVQRYLFV